MKNIIFKKYTVLYVYWLMAFFSSYTFADEMNVSMAFLTEKMPTPPALSNLDPILSDEGIQGAILGVKDNNTTGQFTGHHYDLKHIEVRVGDDVVVAFE
ncbi:MAG: branched-chain amino acid ABC transporter substrate-binding protein, partial [Cycloclasticus sp.]|nr:branched-chain amino acid ABC transporter substrate-binding protein [Cycloclasticus sp.]